MSANTPQVASAAAASAAPPRVDPAVQHELSEVAVLVVVLNTPPDNVRPGDWHEIFTGQSIVVDGPKEAGTTVLKGTRLVMYTTPYFDTLSAAEQEAQLNQVVPEWTEWDAHRQSARQDHA